MNLSLEVPHGLAEPHFSKRREGNKKKIRGGGVGVGGNMANETLWGGKWDRRLQYSLV